MNNTEDIYQSTRNLSRVFSLLSLFLVIYISVFSWQSWRVEKAGQIQNMRNIMELGEKAIDVYFTQMENSMLGLSRDLIETDGQIDLDHAFVLVKRFKESHPELINITFMREDGQILFTAKAPPSPTLPTLAREPSFLKFREELQQNHPLSIGQPLVALTSKEWIIPLRFVINNKEGKLNYIISANVPVGILQSYWKDAPFTKTAALGLMRDDGFLVSRYPLPPKLEMEKAYGIPRTGALITYLKQENFPSNGYVEGPSSLDGPNYLNAFRRLEHFPITLFIAMPMSEIRTGWWDKVKVPYILSALFLIGGFFIYRRTLRLEKASEFERWHASQTQKGLSTFLDGIIENSPVSMWISDDKGNLIRANQALRDQLRISDDELVGKYNIFRDRQVEDQGLMPLVREVFEKGSTARFTIEYDTSLVQELELKRSKQATLDVTISAVVDSEGKVINAIIQHLDVSVQKQAVDALRESEERYRLLFESATDALFLIATDTGMVVKANSIASELYGYDSDELLTKRSMDLSAEPEETRRLTHDAQTAPDRIMSIPLRLHQKKDGTVFPVEITSRSFPLQGRQILLVAARDITERKQAEAEKAELEAQNRQLQKVESLNLMAGAVAHHFNNQLQVVMGNLEMAIDDLPHGSNVSDILTQAMLAVRKAADVSRLMLIYLGQMPGEHEPINLSETCSKGMTLLQAATPKGIIINAEIPSSGPIIRANAGQIQQVLTNLVTNAWESISDNRGTINLTVKTVSHSNIPTSKRFPINWQPQSIPYACLEVADTGCGISNKDIEKLFDPFFTTKFTGRGLGLPVVKGILKAHGGGVTVESEPGHGSIFRVFLPVSTEKLPVRHDLPAMLEALPTSKAEKSSKIEGGGTVLLIEDEDPVRNMAKKMLTRLGYKVLEAKDGVEALEVFQQHQDRICFVLSDLTMPGMDGWDTLAALRKLSPGIPVVLSSGYDEAQVMAGEHSERPNAFLGKPYQLKGLRDTLSRVLTATVHL
ncbi:MAG: PAS domain S-box protein [Pseudomonadota bacterium]